MERLQKVMAQAGVASRRRSEELIRSGRVKVNGSQVTELGMKVDPDHDLIEVNGKRLTLEKKRTFVFYKPAHVITSMHDPQGRKVVADFFRHIPERLFPVGRLDYETEGLLLMTNDGELANRLLHPRHEVGKVYVATIAGKPDQMSIRRLEQGVRLRDGWTVPAKVRLLSHSKADQTSRLEITIHEGRNRQVRRMCKTIGHPVIHLVRTRFGFLTLEGLKKGEARELKAEELRRFEKL
ncbi:pseudouridine synthase [Thermoactinomyces mirandus]|uniref:Pseudouridine synthase n=1 Tax=Thermoactinomyces mirandus TaxID=2756294 RepID=A0A7W1XVA3_9BACL|nr:pseudouridine synthase [Thermoactinomyces mirandus]MBA4603841.1 rRNA pseudouridine synthase [Thermoactinomyces mirandus]